jgi:hypothetical protein
MTTFDDGDFKYIILSASTVGVYGLSESVVLPLNDPAIPNTATYNGGTSSTTYSVTTIEARAFYDCSGLNGTLTIPNSVTTIEDYAFSGCSKLLGALTIGNSVTTIGNNAFQGCFGLSGTLIIPHKVTTIGAGAFDGCQTITTVRYYSNITGNNLTNLTSGFFQGTTLFIKLIYIVRASFNEKKNNLIQNKIIRIPTT